MKPIESRWQDSLRAESFKRKYKMHGTITYYNNARGYGFITATTGEQYFFHVTNFVKGEAPPVLEGRVRFDVAPAVSVGKKAQAANLQYIHSAGKIMMSQKVGAKVGE
jgi:cold shock CspA family protein